LKKAICRLSGRDAQDSSLRSGRSTRYIEAQLFGVTATDPLTFVSGCVVLGMAGLTASAIPALRAMRVDPISALRQT
jgi:hypothetical protein